MPYVATINVPGYLPTDDDPPVFDTVSEAWEYLADERREAEDDDELADGYSETVNILEQCQAGAMDDYANASLDIDGTGTVYGGTPGGRIHDLGIAYTVAVVES